MNIESFPGVTGVKSNGKTCARRCRAARMKMQRINIFFISFFCESYPPPVPVHAPPSPVHAPPSPVQGPVTGASPMVPGVSAGMR